MKKRIKPIKKKAQEVKKPLGEKLADGLDIPKEIVYDVPYITLIGDKEIQIENFISIIAYQEEYIRLKTKCGMLTIEGKKLEAKSMDSEAMTITGCIQTIAFTK